MKAMLDLIEDQLVANRLPVAGITIAATPLPNTPVILTVHWHAFIELRLAEAGKPVSYQSVPSSALQVNRRWDCFRDLELETLETAWELGAWDLERASARPCQRAGADHQEMIECMTAFGIPPFELDGEPPVISEAPDAADLVETAAHAGYVCWRFRPVWCGIWAEVANDTTLEKGGYRNPTCPLMAQAYEPGLSHRIVYRLGQHSDGVH